VPRGPNIPEDRQSWQDDLVVAVTGAKTSRDPDRRFYYAPSIGLAFVVFAGFALIRRRRCP
jgi:hypothetical protein